MVLNSTLLHKKKINVELAPRVILSSFLFTIHSTFETKNFQFDLLFRFIIRKTKGFSHKNVMITAYTNDYKV